MGIDISPDGRFEWDSNKNILNKEDHGFYFDNSTTDEVCWKGNPHRDPTGSRFPSA
jgi:uncharacterized DUF497 family protein